MRLNRVTAGLAPAIYVKVEWYGATGSLKDRIYLHMFERAEARGELQPGMRVLECSTGNAGIACAWVAAVKGYPCTIVMPEGMSEERKKIMRAYGAELVFTPGGESDVDLSLAPPRGIRAAAPGRTGCLGSSTTRTTSRRTCRARPRDLGADAAAGSAPSWTRRARGDAHRRGRYLRARDPGVRLYAVEPAECALLARRAWGHHGIEGIGDGFVPGTSTCPFSPA